MHEACKCRNGHTRSATHRRKNTFDFSYFFIAPLTWYLFICAREHRNLPFGCHRRRERARGGECDKKNHSLNILYLFQSMHKTTAYEPCECTRNRFINITTKCNEYGFVFRVFFLFFVRFSSFAFCKTDKWT